MKEQLTAIFDIGKTNKKFFLFNSTFKEVYREYVNLEEIEDEDGYPTEDLQALQNWLKSVIDRILASDRFKIRALNFSSYGASLVHLDDKGKVLTPLYNYTKPYDESLLDEFYENYGPATAFSMVTGTSRAGMLNSGMQLYWIKKRKPGIFKKIRYSLHLPQYLSYLFTGIPLSDYTSIGCHTGLWDYERKDYHRWVYEEGIDKKLPPVVSTETSINTNYSGRYIKVGVGIHDSSAALLPYIRSLKKPFILLSTGTWNIAVNPFTEGQLSASDLKDDCINYMRVNGTPVKASRLFLGKEYNHQVKELAKEYKVRPDFHRAVKFNREIYTEIQSNFRPMFGWKYLKDLHAPATANWEHHTFETAYHQLMLELVQMQAGSIRRAIGTSDIKRLYIDGGFSDNQVFLELLSNALNKMKIRTTNASLGSAMGAAIVISDRGLNPKFLKENYALQKHIPLIL